MKKLVLLFAALLVAGCGEKSSSEGSESASEKPTPPSEDVKPSADSPEPLISDADVERFAKDAMDSLAGGSPPDDYTGWSKIVVQGQLVELMQWKNGKPDGRAMLWHDNGKIANESIFTEDKDEPVESRSWYESGEKESEITTANDGSSKVREWHKNGQKKAEGTMKDFDQGSEKYWNSKGEEVETKEEAEK